MNLKKMGYVFLADSNLILKREIKYLKTWTNAYPS